MKATLTKILTYHVVAGKIDAAEIAKGIKAGGGSYNMKTVEGETLTAKMDGDKVALIDAKGTGALVETRRRLSIERCRPCHRQRVDAEVSACIDRAAARRPYFDPCLSRARAGGS